MKVLVLTVSFPSKSMPASGIFLANTLRALRPHVDDLLVIAPRVFVPRWLGLRERWRKYSEDPLRDEWNGIEVLRPRVPTVPGQHRAWWSYRVALPWLRRAVRSVQRERGFDWLIGYSLFLPGLWAAAMRDEVPHTAIWAIGSDVHTYAPKSRFSRRAAAWALGGVDLTICVSDYIRDLVREMQPRVRSAVTFYEGIDAGLFRDLPDRSALRRELGLADDRKYMIYVGCLSEAKGILELTACFEQVAARHPEWDLILIGPAAEQVGASAVTAQSLHSWMAKSGLQGRVVLTGVLPNDRVARYLAASDLFVFATRAEAIGTVLLEAGAAGLPIVSTDAGGNREFVGDDEAGLLVPVRDADAMAAAVERMIRDPSLRKRCAQEARRRALERFDVWQNVHTLRQLLEQSAHA